MQQRTKFIEFSAHGSHDGLADNEWLSPVHIHEDHNHTSAAAHYQRCHHDQTIDEINSEHPEHGDCDWDHVSVEQ